MSTYLIKVENENGSTWGYAERAKTIVDALSNYIDGKDQVIPTVKSVQFATEHETYRDVIHFVSCRLDNLFTELKGLNERGRDLAGNISPHEDRLVAAETQWEIYHLAQGMESILGQVKDMCHLHHAFSEGRIDLTLEEDQEYRQRIVKKRVNG